MGHPVALVLAVLVGLATAYCLARCVVPRWRHEHGVVVDAWHVAMGAAMVAMLVAPVGSRSAIWQAAVFGVGALWCACHLLARHRSGAHVRLGVACAVMVAMLMPAVPATAADPVLDPMAGHHHGPGMDMSQASTQHAMALPPVWLAVLMLVAVAAIALLAARAALAGADRRTTSRVSLGCEVVMAAAMGYMAALAFV